MCVRWRPKLLTTIPLFISTLIWRSRHPDVQDSSLGHNTSAESMSRSTVIHTQTDLNINEPWATYPFDLHLSPFQTIKMYHIITTHALKLFTACTDRANEALILKYLIKHGRNARHNFTVFTITSNIFF